MASRTWQQTSRPLGTCKPVGLRGMPKPRDPIRYTQLQRLALCGHATSGCCDVLTRVQGCRIRLRSRLSDTRKCKTHWPEDQLWQPLPTPRRFPPPWLEFGSPAEACDARSTCRDQRFRSCLWRGIQAERLAGLMRPALGRAAEELDRCAVLAVLRLRWSQAQTKLRADTARPPVVGAHAPSADCGPRRAET